MSRQCSLGEVPSEALLYTGAGEITNVVVLALDAGSKASTSIQGPSGSAAIAVCKIICLYYVFGPCWQAFSLLVFVLLVCCVCWCAIFIQQKPSTLPTRQEVINHWEAARKGFLNHLSHCQCCVNTAHLLHIKDKSYGIVIRVTLSYEIPLSTV